MASPRRRQPEPYSRLGAIAPVGSERSQLERYASLRLAGPEPPKPIGSGSTTTMSFLRAMWRRWPNGTVTGIASVVARNVVAGNVVAGNVVAGNVVAGN